MKILMIADVYKPVINGVTFSIETFSRHLRKLGHKVTLLVPDYPGSPYEKDVLRLFSFPFPFHREQRIALFFSGKRMRQVFDEDWDVVHVHTPFSCGLAGLRIAAKAKRKAPVVFTYHTLFEEYAHYIPLPRIFVKKLAVFWSKRFCNVCDFVIAPSLGIKDILISYGVTKPIEVLPTPVDYGSFRSVSEKSPYETKLNIFGKKICLYVGRIGEEKNLDFLLRAFKKIHRDVPDAQLVLVGDGPRRSRLKNRARRLGLSDCVTFAGYVSRSELGDWFAKADLFLFASVTETQGMALAEALQFGLPAVIVQGRGTGERIRSGFNGFVTGENEDEFAESACKLLKNEELRKNFSRAAVLAAEELRPERIISSLVEVYEGARHGKRNKSRS